MQEWQIESGGVVHTIRVEQGQGEKTFVRANGKMIAPPLGPADAERLFSLGDQSYRLFRTDGGFDLEPLQVIEEPPEVEPSRKPSLPVMPLGLRSRIYFALALLIFLGSSCAGLSSAAYKDRANRQLNVALDRDAATDRALDRANAAMNLITSALTWQAFFAFLGFVGAASLARGARWAPRFLETITWLMLAFVFFSLARIDRVLHVQTYAAFPPLLADSVMSRYHYLGAFLFIVAALLLGFMLNLIRSDITSEQVLEVY
jgi:hypothetical protein